MVTRPISSSRPTLQLVLVVLVAVTGISAVSLGEHTGAGTDLLPLLRASADIADGQPVFDDPRFVYPPSAAVLAVPLSALPSGSAVALVQIVLAFSVLLAVLLSATSIGETYRSWAVLVAALLVVTSPVFHQGILLANVGAAMPLAIAGMTLLLSHGRPGAAGVALGLALALKPVLAPLLLVLLLMRRWSALTVAVAIPLALSAIGLAWAVDGADYFTTSLPFLLAGQDEFAQQADASLQGLALRFGLESAVIASLRVVVALGTVWAVWRRVNRGGRDEDTFVDAGAIVLGGAFIALVVSFDHYALLLVPLAVLALVGRSAAKAPLLWCGLAVVFLSFPLPNVPDDLWRPGLYTATAFLLVWLALVVGVSRAPQNQMAPAGPGET